MVEHTKTWVRAVPIGRQLTYFLDKKNGTTRIALVLLAVLGLVSSNGPPAFAGNMKYIAGPYAGKVPFKEEIFKLVEAHEKWLDEEGPFSASVRRGRLDFRGVILLPTRISLQQCDLRYADFRGAELPGLDLVCVNLGRARLERARLDRSALFLAKLNDASLQDATLWHADLRRCDLTGADLEGALLDRADMCDAELRGAKLKGTSFNKTDMRGVSYDPFPLSPPDVEKISRAKNLCLMWCRNTPEPMERLRDRFRTAGMHRQTRELSIAIFFSRFRDGGRGIRDRLVAKAQEAVGWIHATVLGLLPE